MEDSTNLQYKEKCLCNISWEPVEKGMGLNRSQGSSSDTLLLPEKEGFVLYAQVQVRKTVSRKVYVDFPKSRTVTGLESL